MRLRSLRDEVLASVTRNGRALRRAPEELRADREIVLVAVKQNWYALQYAAEACAPFDVVTPLMEAAGRTTWANAEEKKEFDQLLLFKKTIMKHGQGFLDAVPDHYWEKPPHHYCERRSTSAKSSAKAKPY